MQFLETPNLPEADVCLAAVSGTYGVFVHALEKMGVKVIPVCSNGKLHESVKDHADLMIHHLGGNQVFIAANEPALKSAMQKFGFCVMELTSQVLSPYPNDVKLNSARLGKKLIANPKTTALELMEFCLKQEIRIIPVKQGYAKCSAAIIDEHSIITSDRGIARAAAREKIDVLLIRPGHILLRGCGYGFIGGACGKIGKDKIAFAGRIQEHPDYLQIRDFLQVRGIKAIVLADCPLTDIGGILPLCSYGASSSLRPKKKNQK